MQRRYPILVLLSLLAVGLAVTITVFMSPTGLPFAWEMVDTHTVSVIPVKGVAFPAGLVAGDIVKLPEQSPAVRNAFVASYQDDNVRAGLPMTLVVEREGTRVTVPFIIDRLNHVPQFWVSALLSTIFAWLVALTVLITLWRGRDWGAWGISLWGIAFLAGLTFADIPVTGWGPLATIMDSAFMYMVARIGFYVMAETIAGPALKPRGRWTLRLLFALFLLAGLAYEMAYPPLLVFAGRLVSQHIATLWALPYLLATIMLLVGYRRADAARRQRLRWMFWSALILTVGIEFSNVPLIGTINSQLVNLGAFVIAIAGLLYAVLRHRVVDMAFVVNRALVYSGTLSVVIGIFILLESFVEKIALPHNANLILELGVPLMVGFSLDSVRKRLENISERLFFRRKFKAEAALRAFSNHCAYIVHPDKLLEQTLRELHNHSNAPAVALYWHDVGGYRRLGESGEHRYPEKVDMDDRAIVALRADRNDIDLEDLGSALGTDGLLIPMIVRGELLGAVVLGNRPGEHYPPDERELLRHVIHEIGAAMDALRARENARLVNALAAGALTPDAAMMQARALAEPA
ncbi:MAG: GAF domain-containing protein [Gammaproteobacteria bacterium]